MRVISVQLPSAALYAINAASELSRPLLSLATRRSGGAVVIKGADVSRAALAGDRISPAHQRDSPANCMVSGQGSNVYSSNNLNQKRAVSLRAGERVG